MGSEQEEHKRVQRMQADQSKSLHVRRVDFKLDRMKDHEAVELVLYHAAREVTKTDFNSGFDHKHSIKKQMEVQQVIMDCRGLPYLLLQVVNLLNKNNELKKIVVEKKGKLGLQRRINS